MEWGSSSLQCGEYSKFKSWLDVCHPCELTGNKAWRIIVVITCSKLGSDLDI